MLDFDTRRSAAAAAFIAVLIAGTSACSDSTGLGSGAITLSFAAAPSSGAALARAAGARLSLDVDGSGALVITRARIVLREIELESPEYLCGSIDDTLPDGDYDGCDVQLSPRVVDLPLDGGAMPLIDVQVPEGTYDAIELELHKPDDGTPQDVAFMAANPEFDRISVRVEGTWNGTPFVYETEQDAEMELEFGTPLVVGVDGVNITVNVDVASWFRSADGSALEPSAANAGQIDDRIRQSFRAFEDDDRDGHDDDN